MSNNDYDSIRKCGDCQTSYILCWKGDHNHLFIRQGTGLQGQAVFRTKLSFRPHSTESFTHRKMTLSLADRSQKTSGIKILSQVGADPDHDRKTLLKVSDSIIVKLLE